MARRRMMGDSIELDYNGREIVFREDLDEWGCHTLKLKAKSLATLKRKIDKLDGEARRVSLPVVVLSKYGSTNAEPANVVMLAKRTDWERLRYDERTEILDPSQRYVPTVWVMVPDGNHAPTRKKVRLDECALPTESTTIALREVARLRAEARRLGEEAGPCACRNPARDRGRLEPWRREGRHAERLIPTPGGDVPGKHKETTMAVYLVKVPDGSERLVEAANKASARNHVARSCLDIAVAKQADLFRVAKANGEIETAGEDAAEPEAEVQPEVEPQGEVEDGKPKK
jgi:hypothetical protein